MDQVNNTTDKEKHKLEDHIKNIQISGSISNDIWFRYMEYLI